MLLSLDFSNGTPIYRQLCNQIVVGIASGGLAPGEKLPAIRALAEELGVNTMTVNKAYALLRDEGYLTADRGGGTVVAVRPGAGPLPSEAAARLRVIASEARIAGISEADFLALCRSFYREEGALDEHF